MGETKIFAIVVIQIFYVPIFFRLFMMSLKYGLIKLKCYSTDSVLFLSPLLSY